MTAAAIEPSGRGLALKAAAAAVLCHRLVGRAIGLVFGGRIPHRGDRIAVLAGGDPRLNAYLFWGLYESAEIRFIERFVHRGMDVVELGASIGGVSCAIARRLSPQDRLVCVEANPDIVGLLSENLGRNAPGREVSIVNAAVSYSSAGTVTFALGSDTLSSQIGAGEATRTVPALTLTALLDREGLGDYALVCDIEGAEAELFEREGAAFARCHTIVIELHEIRQAGHLVTIDELIRRIRAATGMTLAARYGEVCAFTR